MSRALWFVAGAGAGVYAMTRVRRIADALTPEGLADRLAGLSVGARLFSEEVRAGMDEKESDVRARLGQPRAAPPAPPAELAPAPGVGQDSRHELGDHPGPDREGND